VRIAILEVDPAERSATGVRGRAMAEYLRGRGHDVAVLHPPAGFLERFSRTRFSFKARALRRLSGRKTLPHLWDAMSEVLRKQIRRGGFDVVIGRGQNVAYSLVGMGGLVRILDLPNVEFLENYYSSNPNLVEVDETFLKEQDVLREVDHILVPHPLLARLISEAFPHVGGLERKVVNVRIGAEPASRQAQFAWPPRIVYAGSYYYFQDPYLLSLLSGSSPFPIDCYGSRDPNRGFLPTRLQYKGYLPTADFLADYQFGLITVSQDRLRRYSPTTKMSYYLMHGLPVLFPEWMREGYDHPECAVPYTEESFASVVRESSERPTWERLAAAAREAARALAWEDTLAPIARLVEAPRSLD
jgi:hypothetical protein